MSAGLACGAPSGAPVGVSERPWRGASAAPAVDAGAADAAAALPADYRARFAKVNKARFVSSGHAAGRWELDVYANELAERALAARARDVPIGAVVVAEHFERGSDAGVGPIMVMEKRRPGFSPDHGDWRFVVVGASGRLVKEGAIESCAGCHDDAPMDGMFPILE